jgi:rifampicin phosphotransferase
MNTKLDNINLNTDTIIYKFPSNETPMLSEVGGKGLSLIKGSQSNLPVPPGFILTVSFFTPWLNKIKEKYKSKNILEYSDEQLISYCKKIKNYSKKFSLDNIQKQLLSDILKTYKKTDFFAVRSSSPEEDLDGSSFAGGYETILGVRVKEIESAIRKVFISCLDHRVFIYKRKNGFDITQPKIAVVIQLQIASEISGVGFSINPINNSFDEIILNSNWGLGETVVSGTVTPDTYVINKVTKIINKVTIGNKEKSLCLNTKGGTTEKINYKSDKKTLTDAKIRKLAEIIKQVETIYNKPMDIEWAFAGNNLYLLQARPITAYVPISSEMLTASGARKILYQDITISVQGLEKPMSIMGTSIYNLLAKHLWKMLFKKDLKLSPKSTLLWINNGKFYLNLSVMLGFVSKDKMSAFMSNMDSLAAQTMENIDDDIYTSKNINVRKYKLTILRILLKASPYILRAMFFPKYTHKLNQKKFEKFEKKTTELFNDKNLSLTQFAEELFDRVSILVFKYSAPIALSARGLLGKFKSKSDLITDREYEKLCLTLPHNVTTEMNLELSNLSSQIPNITESDFYEKLIKNELSNNIKTTWNKFLTKYGHRCPGELDVATPRYRDELKSLVRLLYSVHNVNSNSISQLNKLKQQIKQRQDTYKLVYKKIRKRKGFLKAKIFQFIYRYTVTFAGYRETHKYYVILVIDLIRQRILQESETLTKVHRLDSKQQAFDLKLEELELGIKNNNFDLKKTAANNVYFINRLKACSSIPTIFDSRGLIHKPPIPDIKEGEIAGTPVSSGKAKGPIKIMHTPTEKPFNKGDILVAKATDPAWTPLFVNASAVILEIGGMLQHGALVAREYGLPCIVGIENATEKWVDGEIVEIDATTGIIKNLN